MSSGKEFDWHVGDQFTVIIRSIPTVPDAPILTGIHEENQVTLSWDTPCDGGIDITGHEYRQRVRTGAFGPWILIPNSATGGVNVTSYTLTGVNNPQDIVYEVRAVNELGVSLPSAETIPISAGFILVSDRTPAVRDAIVARVPGVNSAADVTEAHLAAITQLFLSNKGITSLKSGDFDGLTALTELYLNNNGLSSLPVGVFDGLTALTELYLSHSGLSSLSVGVFDGLTALTILDLWGNGLSSLPVGVFDRLTALTSINLPGNDLSSLPAGVFDGLTALTELSLNNNGLSSLPAGVFDGLTALTTLSLGHNTVNPLPLTVSLQKVADGQFKAVAPAGAPFEIVLPLIVTNGSINSGATTLTIPAGNVESEPLTVTRTAGTTATVTVDIGTLPRPAFGHTGYELVKSADLPLAVIGATAPQVTGINIPDANLRAKIETALSKTAGDPITATEMATLTSLTAQDARITNLTGLETATNLTTLKLGNNTISDISALSGLTNLTELQLWDNQLANLSDLSGLTNLTALYLWGNSISDISHLSGLTSLTRLRLGENNISNIAAVSSLRNLTYLSVKVNAISNISAVSGLTNLTQLQIGNNIISDITPVQNLTNLEWLDMPNNSISDISAVQNLTQLVELYFQNNAVSDLSPLVTNTGLGTDDEIDVRGNPLSYPSIWTHIPALQAKNVYVDFDNRVATAPVKISGDTQQGNTGATLTQPFVVEVQDASSVAFAGVPVTFAVTAGGGTLSATNTTTDVNGRAQSTLTLGNTAGTNTVSVSVTGITQANTFTATATAPVVVYITPVGDRTSQVAEAILGVVRLDYPSVSSYAGITTTHLAAPTVLYLNNKSITALKSGDFDGLTGLEELRLNNNQLTSLSSDIFSGLTSLSNLNLFNNQLSSLPDGIFEGLTSLTKIRLGRNTVNPLPVTVSLEKVAEGQFKVIVPTGALFAITVPISVTNGSITGGASSVTIPKGSIESDTLTVTRTAGTTNPVTVDIGTLPSLPRNHYGYALVKSGDLPLAVITGVNTTPIFTDGTTTTRSIAENTAAAMNIGTPIAATDAENDTLTYTLRGTDASAFDIDSSTGQLKTKVALDYETKASYTMTITVSDGSLIGTITVTINVTDINEVVTVDVDPPTPDPPTPDPPTPDPPTPVQTNTAPEFVDGDSTIRVVSENTLTGVNIGQPVTATDTVGDQLVYTLGGVDADAFDIDSDGQLKTKSPLDYETKRVYPVTITVDDGDLTDTITVIISVIDVNDTGITSAFLPVSDRTPEVRDAIVAAIPGITAASQVTDAHLATITRLNLRNLSISSLKTGDFSGLTTLTNLNLFNNMLSSLPSGIFEGLTSLTTLRLGSNAIDPLPLVVSIQQVNSSEYQAVIATGAPFNIVLPINVMNGSISGGITSVTIPQGSAESAAFTVISTSTATPTVVFGTLPGLPANHFGYTFAQSNVCNRTEAVADAIASAVGVGDCSDVTEADLTTITRLDLSGKSIASLDAGDFAGMFSLTTLYLENNDLTSLPNGIFDDLISLNFLSLNDNKLTSLPSGIFSDLTSLTTLDVFNNDISSLQSGVFDGLSSLTTIDLNDNELTSLSGDIFDGLSALTYLKLSNNKLTTLSAGLFDGLTSLAQLQLNGNPVDPLPIVVSLQKVGTNQFKAVAPTGAPFAMTLPITVQNGTIVGGATTITIPTSTVESQPLTVTRTPGTVNAVTANIGNQLPTLPATHNGYAFVKSTTLPVEVIPPLNSAPVFTEGVNTIRTVAENTAAGVNIGDVVAATDRDANTTLTYTLGGTDAALFDIDSTNGQLKTKSALDFETKVSYTVVLTVSDGRATDTITVTITVIDVDENRAPVFTEGESTTRSIAENTLAGENIGTPVAATDADEDTLAYSLSGPDAAAFGIDTTTGQLKTSTLLDYETKNTYTVTITVSDGKLTVSIAVTISITDVEELPSRIGVCQVGSVLAHGQSCTYPGTAIEFSVNNNGSGKFLLFTSGNSINIKNSVINGDSYTLVAEKQGNGSWEIKEIGEFSSNNPPQFPDGETATRTVVEDTPSGVDIGSAMSATDADGHTLTYTLGGTDADKFSIDSTSGQLRTSAPLDYETKSSYTVEITATDGTDSTTITVTINVANKTENRAPVFTAGSSTTRSIAENTGSGVDIGSAVPATDADGDTLSYSLGGTDASSFSIDSTSGQLRTSSSLDYENKSTYTVTITVSDGSLTDSITITINITDIDETPSNNSPVFDEGSSTSRTVVENTGSGVDIGSAVSATDADGDTLSYSLSGTDASSFSIDSTTGQIRTSSSLNYETKTTYTVTVTASDGSFTDSITVTINVTNTNDAPVFTAGTSTTRSIAENTNAGVNIGSAISATDDEDDTLTYSIGGADAAAFTLISTTGLLRTKVPFDYETKNAYSVTITVSDGNGGSDSINVTINVTDVNENSAPTFTDGTSATRSIAENAPADTNIGTAVAATDADDDTLAYTLSGTDAAAFTLISTTGLLRTKVPFDYETKNAYSVTITVSDGNGGSDSINVTINVTDVNENSAPTFTDGTSTTRSIAENAPVNTNIGSAISATDADNDTLAYTLGGTDAASFSIDTVTGQLQTSAALDFETKTTYTVTITVTDGSLTDTITVTINVTDLDERPSNSPPVFTEGNTATRSVAENTASTVNIGTPVAATDVDNNTLAYLLSGADAASFSIDSEEGQLKTGAALNYEVKSSYTVTITVTDGTFTDTITVTINVTDANDAPIFTDDTTTTRSVAENTVASQNIGTAVDATDADSSNTLTYSLGGTDAASFDIVSTSGQLQTKAALDYEKKTSHSVTVSVSDGNGGSDSITVTINVTDVNENRAPVFADDTSTTRSVAENTGFGATIGSAVGATDADNDTLNYTLGGTDASSFSINSTNGQLQTKAALDYEKKISYSVTVSVSDGNGGSDSITVTINVTDVNENRAPVFTDGNSTSRSVAENTGSGATIGSAVGATDADNDTLNYTLGGTDAASFGINSTNGQLRTSAALDYEDTTSYSVTVTVTDGKGGSDSITVTINVTDVNENRAPVFTDDTSTTRSVAENTGSGVNIGSAVGATDADDDTLTYSLGGTDASSFGINSTNGQLRTSAALDYEDTTSYSVTVTVTDGNGGSDSIAVTINVTDVNENRAPVFTDGATTTRSVAENTGSGVNIGSAVGATDADDDTLTYSLGGTDASSFSINSTNGRLRTSASLDYEDTTSYSVTVTVTDGNGGTDSITVTINVTDVNENRAPVFTDGSSTTRSVAENTASGQNIGSAVAATDADSDDTLTYTLGGTDVSSFSINSTNGQLRTSASLDYEDTTSYSVTVTVTDGNGGTDSITVTINVTDVNENRAPVFTDGTSTTRSVAENTGSGVDFGSAVGATDADNDTLEYALRGTDAASFSIDSTSGQLRTNAALDYETKASYSVRVRVSDGNKGVARIDVTITVTDVDENRAPVFTDGATTTRSVAENTASGQNIGDAVAATDADNDTLTYTLGGTDAASFSIVTTSGQLQTSASLDYETKTSYTVTVSVSDGNSGTDSITVTINVTDVDEATIDPPLNERTQQVQDAIVAAAGVASAADVTAAHLAAITYLSTPRDTLTSLKSGDFSGLTNLTTLRMFVSKLTSLPTGIFDNLTNLTTLNMSYNDLTSLPSGVFDNLTNLTSLDLTGTDLTSLPSGVFDNLTNLTTLDMYSNDDLTSLPSGIFDNLTNLTTLDMSFNALRSLPSGVFDNLTNLTTLHLDDNALTSLRSGVFDNLTSLTVLELSDNTLTSLRSGVFDNLTSLTSLYLSDTSISDISELEDLTSLTTLTLYNNSISNISALEDLTNLTSLRLENNSISDISALEDLTNLTSLRLAGNSISDYGPLRRLIAAIEAAGRSLTLDITIPPVSGNNAPVFTDGPTTTRSVAENTASGENIGDAVAATDADNDTLTYSLGGTDAASFDIVSSSGQLQTKAALDYETKTSYTVTVSVSDGNGGSDSITVTINVTDVGPPPPPLAPITINITTCSGTERFGGLFDITVGGTITANQRVRIISVTGYLNTALIGVDGINEILEAGDTVNFSTSGVWNHDGSTSQTCSATVDYLTFAAPSAQAIPAKSALLPNFPNPFNPETWIPYELSKPAEVTLTIYNMQGQVIRQLKLGQMPAGVYRSRSRAIHWDGRNIIGEKVAAGVYFYTLTAGDFTATRKMLIRK